MPDAPRDDRIQPRPQWPIPETGIQMEPTDPAPREHLFRRLMVPSLRRATLEVRDVRDFMVFGGIVGAILGGGLGALGGGLSGSPLNLIIGVAVGAGIGAIVLSTAWGLFMGVFVLWFWLEDQVKALFTRRSTPPGVPEEMVQTHDPNPTFHERPPRR